MAATPERFRELMTEESRHFHVDPPSEGWVEAMIKGLPPANEPQAWVEYVKAAAREHIFSGWGEMRVYQDTQVLPEGF